MSIGQRLLGMFQTQPDQFQTLLGQYYDPRTARQQWLGGTLQGLGAGLASGEPGAWAQGAIAGGGQGVEDYRKRALLGYQMQQQADNQAYDRSRDAKADEWRQKTFDYNVGQDAEAKRRWEIEQARLAENNRLLRERQVRQWGQEDAITQGQIGAIDQWTDNFKSQGGDLFSPEMQGVLRSNGIAGVDPQDTVKFRQAQPFIGAGAVGPAFDVLAAPAAPKGVTADVEARKAAAAGMGLTPDDPAYKSYVLTGKMPREDQAPLTATDKTAILNADESVLANTTVIDQLNSVLAPGPDGKSLNDKAGYGSTAGVQSWAARNDPTGLFDDTQGQATTELSNIILGQALSSLKSIFGAAPTEGERKILVDLQASVDKTPAEREAIIKRAITLANARLKFNQERAAGLRGGTYYKSGGGNAAPADNADPLGLR